VRTFSKSFFFLSAISAPRLSFFLEHSFARVSSASTFFCKNASRFCMPWICCGAQARRASAARRRDLQRVQLWGRGAAHTSFRSVTTSVAFGGGAASFFLPYRWFIVGQNRAPTRSS